MTVCFYGLVLVAYCLAECADQLESKAEHEKFSTPFVFYIVLLGLSELSELLLGDRIGPRAGPDLAAGPRVVGACDGLGGLVVAMVGAKALFGVFTLFMLSEQAFATLTGRTKIDRLKQIHHERPIQVNEVFGGGALWRCFIPVGVLFPQKHLPAILGYSAGTFQETPECTRNQPAGPRSKKERPEMRPKGVMLMAAPIGFLALGLVYLSAYMFMHWPQLGDWS
mmetsp:Transcript_31425/g.70638  ORF Transcript_31425/g.70638 Transcript_31425/m.70638 type:complete len:224 (+) Transcript_31425:274-945(+)